MTDLETRFHETWLGMVQPDGLVVSVPVLTDAQCMERHPPSVQRRLLELCPTVEGGDGARSIANLALILSDLLGLTPDLFDRAQALPEDLALYVPEGGQTIRPSLALKKQSAGPAEENARLDRESTPASRAGEAYVALIWEVPEVVDLDKPEQISGPWAYPASAKFDRLLRHCRVPIGLLTNRSEIRLIYAPHGASSGSIRFRIEDMATVGGRPILDAFVMLLSARRFFAVAIDHQLPALLIASRTRQANVTNKLAEQVFEALEILLQGFDAAAERDGRALLQDALEREDDYLYGGLLTVLLRLVFLLYAEDRGLLPVEHSVFEESYSLQSLFEELQADYGAHPDSMSRRYGAWGRLIALFRSVFLGVEHGSLRMPSRRGELFDPHLYPFLEGWGPGGSAPIKEAEERAAVRVPSVDDETVFHVLKRLIVLEGQRLSYRALDVEQIGAVYEALMGYHVVRLSSAAVCMRPHRIWVTAADLSEVSTARRDKWLKDEIGLPSTPATTLAAALKTASTEEQLLTALETCRARGTDRAREGRLVLQPGTERRRTSSHYTPRSLSAPIVRRTLEPLIATMGEAPSSDRLLDLVICDPAMGSGAFLVEACRFLADQVVAAWTREKKLALIADVQEDVVNHARRLVAQRCLYGVDKNRFAVNLAKLSLWLVTLAKEAPFTFVDHALRHGDSLVGLDYDQIRSFHWKRSGQLELFTKELEGALSEAVGLRQRILELAHDGSSGATHEKERLLWDAEDASDRVRLIGDLAVGAFFSGTSQKERESERNRRLEIVDRWLRGDDSLRSGLMELRRELRTNTTTIVKNRELIRPAVHAFHWFVEFPEIFWPGRVDPLNPGMSSGQAYVDAFVSNPPFMGQKDISHEFGECYRDWLFESNPGTHGKTDIAAHFLRRAAHLSGPHGTMGLITTDKIAQGDTHESGLFVLVQQGWRICDAISSMPWPGAAAVSIAVINLARGNPTRLCRAARLDGQCTDEINSRLRSGPERTQPVQLRFNRELSFRGCELAGRGFILNSEERTDFIAASPDNAQRIFQYIGGEDLNSSPRQDSQRYVIDFAQMSIEEAGRWPALLDRVRALVKPERDQTNRASRRNNWWRFGEVQPAMRKALAAMNQCIAIARDPQHFCFSIVPTANRIYSEKVYLFALDSPGAFAVLQSRVHIIWALREGRTTGSSGTPSYSNTRCFETFPLPTDFSKPLTKVEFVGRKLHSLRSKYMIERGVGLTTLYNRLKAKSDADKGIGELRDLHEEMDRLVLAAYQWSDLEVPPFGDSTRPEEEVAVETFEEEIMDRLFALNARRAAEEQFEKEEGTRRKKKPTNDGIHEHRESAADDLFGTNKS